MRVTASKVGLLQHCQFFATPDAEWSDTTSPAADRGTRFHRAIASYIETGEFSLASTDDDIIALCEVAQRWVDAFGREKLAAEVAFSWDPVTDKAEVLGHNVGRDYSAGADRLCGSADLVAVNRAGRTGYIGDWSTGDGTAKGPQLRALAVMVARAEGLDSVSVEALEVTADGVRHVCNETLDSFDLSVVAGEMSDAIASVHTAEPVPGPWCGDMYCPARATCPTVRERIADIIPAAELTQHRWGLAISSPDHAAWLYNQAKAVEAAAKLVKDAVKAFVPAEGIVLADGSVMAEGTRKIERFDRGRALALMREKGATEEEIEACSRVVVESAGLRVTGGAAKPRKRRAA